MYDEWGSIVLGNGIATFRYLAITWTNADLSIRFFRSNFNENYFVQKDS